MADRIIQTADLSRIASNLEAIHGRIAAVDTHVDAVEGELLHTKSELEALVDEFHAFVNEQMLRNREQLAETRVVKLRQEIQKRFGHYDVVRRMATGILQATDIGIIRKEIINNATEDVMIKTPGYWLAPCLVALAAWIADNKELAQKAVKEAIARDDEKTSLFFALICRRADRKLACIKWVNRYLANQDEENLDRKTILVLSAYANGLWGNDLENEVGGQMKEWLEHLEAKPGFVEKQREQWKQAILLKKPDLSKETDFPYLQQYSPTWPAMAAVLSGAYLHEVLYDDFDAIFQQKNPTKELTAHLDDMLDELVTNFDDEELPLRKKEQLEQLVLDFHGDEAEANKHMDVQKTSFETHKNFVQLLTDASMNPELVHADAATQKFAISLSKDWILDAYRDITAANRSAVPQGITFELQGFEAQTQNGENEEEILASWNQFVDRQKEEAMKGNEMTKTGEMCKTLRWVFAVLAVAGFYVTIVAGIIFAVLAVWAYSRYNGERTRYLAAKKVAEDWENNRPKGEEILRALLAEVVDVRELFEKKDAEFTKTETFLKGLAPNQFVRAHIDGIRKISAAE
ncbi:DUF456 domain-containing protein [Mitsuokella sp. WILCCON 0060]|uniref:DUF456 domain-containing protein n=1 Tax=unclassified Mitsuokella TaxID=2637239 RepID=UPI003EFF5868